MEINLADIDSNKFNIRSWDWIWLTWLIDSQISWGASGLWGFDRRELFTCSRTDMRTPKSVSVNLFKNSESIGWNAKALEIPGRAIISPTKFTAFRRVSNWSVCKFPNYRWESMYHIWLAVKSTNLLKVVNKIWWKINYHSGFCYYIVGSSYILKNMHSAMP